MKSIREIQGRVERLVSLAAVLSLYSTYMSPSLLSCTHSEAAAHAVATLAEATLQGGGQIVLSGETAAAVGALTGVQDANGKRASIFY